MTSRIRHLFTSSQPSSNPPKKHQILEHFIQFILLALRAGGVLAIQHLYVYLVLVMQFLPSRGEHVILVLRSVWRSETIQEDAIFKGKQGERKKGVGQVNNKKR